VLDVDNVTKRYGDIVALDGVSLSVASGEVVSLLGANGAGKTSLLALVAGLRRPDDGRIEVAGGDPRRAETRRGLGFAPQELGVYPLISVASNIRLFAEISGLRGEAAQGRVEAAAHALGLDRMMDRRAGELSGGERRRVHVAMALVHDPKLVVLDEPTAGVDLAARADLIRLVGDLAARGAAVIFSTHYLAEAEAVHGRVAILHRGAKVADSTVRSLTRDLPGRIELEFAGDAPTLNLPAGIDVVAEGSVLTVRTTEPERQAAMVLSAASEHMVRLRSVQVRAASLEDAYLAATHEALAEAVL